MSDSACQSTSTLPHTEMDWPEMPLPPGEHRNRAVAAISSCVVMRRNEIFSRYFASISG